MTGGPLAIAVGVGLGLVGLSAMIVLLRMKRRSNSQDERTVAEILEATVALDRPTATPSPPAQPPVALSPPPQATAQLRPEDAAPPAVEATVAPAPAASVSPPHADVPAAPAEAAPTPPLPPYASGLVAPVELWVGDTRVVVKDGTNTQLQFRRYADSLLSALKEAKDETR